MHTSARLAAEAFFRRYCTGACGALLDVGSMDVNGSLRTSAPSSYRYIGIDSAPGNGVDIVLDDPYRFPFEAERFDAVVCTSCMEHDSFFWLTFLECVRVLKVGGHFYLNVPSNGVYHRYPSDNWRFYPDAGLALAAWGVRAGFPVELLESFILNQIDDLWNDFVCVFRKGSSRELTSRETPPPIYQEFPGATNVWLAGEKETIRKEVHPEDLRKLRRAAVR